MLPTDRYTAIRLAALAACDPRTARAYLQGGHIRGDILRARLDAAVEGLRGTNAPPPSTTPPSAA